MSEDTRIYIKNKINHLDIEIARLDELLKTYEAGNFRLFLSRIDEHGTSGIATDDEYRKSREEKIDRLAEELHEGKLERKRVRKMVRTK